jgi:hypothetical protein
VALFLDNLTRLINRGLLRNEVDEKEIY